MVKIFKTGFYIIVSLIILKSVLPYIGIFTLSYIAASNVDTPEEIETFKQINVMNMTLNVYRESCVNVSNNTMVNEIVEKKCLFTAVTLGKTGEIGMALGANYD